MALWTIDCEGSKTDPIFPVHEMAIAQYSKPCYEKWIPSDILACAFTRAQEKLEEAKNKWGSVRGPIAATILTARQLGWPFSSPSDIITDNGDKLDLTIDSPAFVGQMVTEAVRRFIAEEIETAFPTLKGGG